jgi:DNA-binding response OmpR family regulator
VRKKRLLLAQADQAARDRIKDLLPNAEYETVEANNGAEAFALFKTNSVDLVILDSDLAFIPGIELAAMVRRHAPRLPLLMLSAVTRTFAAELPVDVILHKSCNSQRLLEEIDELLNPEPDHSESATREEKAPSPFDEPIPA